MKDCTLVMSLLDEFIDRNLEDDQRSQVGDHLQGCSVCRTELKELQELRSTAQDLPSEVQPARDLWPGIEREITDALPVSRSHRWAWAAAILIAVFAGALWYGRQPAAPSTSARGPEASIGIVAAANTSPTLGDARNSYRAARTELIEVINARRTTLPPETLEVIDTNMALIDEAILEIERALAASPHRDHLESHLLMAYNQQIGLLKRAVRLSTAA